MRLRHAGGPLLMLDGGDGDRPSAQPETTTLGASLETGQIPSCVVAPGFDFADFTRYET